MSLPLMFLFMFLCAVLGYRVISQVPPLLHTPLMSGMNALSGITVLGAISLYSSGLPLAEYWSALAIVLAMINICGGFWVTERMLKMFQNKKSDEFREDQTLWD